jgi:toxin HigB-1
MIRSFKNAATEAAFRGEQSREIPSRILKVARRKLGMIDAAKELDDLRSPPGNRLHRLAKDRKGQHAIRINDQYRVCFTWKDGDAYDIEVTDYHS